MLKSFFGSRQWALWAWGGLTLLIGSVVLEVVVQVWLNDWYRETWDFLQTPVPELKEAISSADTLWTEELTGLAAAQTGKFWKLLGQFALIVFPFITLRVFSTFFAQHYAFRWRQAMTYAYMPLWSRVDREIEGASQRLQQDPERFARLVESLGLGLCRSVATLVGFVPILIGVSIEVMHAFLQAEGLRNAPFSLPLLEWTATTPYSLLWVAVLLALGGTGISFLVGIKLPGLEYNNQRVEARFRKRLVYSEDNKAFADIPSLSELFTGLRFNYFRLYLHYSYFGLWASLFGQFIVITDIILVGTGVLMGILTLGILNQISHAFGRVTESLTYFVNNWTTVTELMSVIKRLREFERNIGFSGARIGEVEPVQETRAGSPPTAGALPQPPNPDS